MIAVITVALSNNQQLQFFYSDYQQVFIFQIFYYCPKNALQKSLQTFLNG